MAAILTVKLMKMTELCFSLIFQASHVHKDARSSSTSPKKHLLTKVNRFQFRLNSMQIFSSGDFSMGMFKTFIINNEKRKRDGWASYAVLKLSKTTSLFLQIEADFGPNMSAAAAENGFVILLLVLSGTVEHQHYYFG